MENKVTLDDLVMGKHMPKFNPIEATGISGAYYFAKDYFSNYIKSLIKGNSLGSVVKNAGLAWGSGIASGFAYKPVVETLQYGIARLTNTALSSSSYGIKGAIAGYEILGGSSAIGTATTAIAPYIPFTGIGIYTMYKGFQKKNPIMVGAGAGIAFAPVYNILGDYLLGSKALLSLVGVSSIWAVGGLALGLGFLTYSLGRRIANWMGFGKGKK